jgi:hypothetical protein
MDFYLGLVIGFIGGLVAAFLLYITFTGDYNE